MSYHKSQLLVYWPWHAPAKIKRGGHFFVLTGMWVFQSISYTEEPTLQNHRPKLGLRSTSSNATKVIPLKLFLDIVPSSSANITRTLRGQPKRLSRNYRKRNGRNVIVYVLISFHSRDVLCTLSRLFVWLGARLFCARLAVHYLADYSVLGSLVKDVRANCFCASLLRTQIHMPRHTSSARA